MTLVLPMAGVQHYVCTLDIKFSGNVTDCPVKGSDCCEGDQEVPECMVATELLPDAELPSLPHVLAFIPSEAVYLPISVEDLKETDAYMDRMEHRRGPPDPLHWYLEQQRLLI